MAGPFSTLFRLALAVGAAAALGVACPGPAAASCVGPVLTVSESSSPPPADGPPAVVHRGQQLVVSGKWFKDGCADTFSSGPGCDPRPIATEAERPLLGIVLVLSQGPRDRALGVADAGPGPDFAARWSVRIPSDARVGRSTLTAAGTTLLVDIDA